MTPRPNHVRAQITQPPIGVRREDPATWPPLAHIDDLHGGPFTAAGLAPALTAAYDQPIGTGAFGWPVTRRVPLRAACRAATLG